MPTYQYRCTSCGDNLEVVQKFTDSSLTECPSCEGELRKVFNAVGVVFKGSGFYATDSRSSSATSKPAAAAAATPASTGASTSSSSTESKAAAS